MEASKTDWINFFKNQSIKDFNFCIATYCHYRNFVLLINEFISVLHFPKDHFFNFAGTHICNFFITVYFSERYP